MSRRKVLVFGGASVTALAAGWLLINTGILQAGKVQVGRVCTEPDRPSLDKVDHTSFDVLLKKYIDDAGMVAYARWKSSAQDLQALDDYLARLGCVDLNKPASAPAKLAFWINAYNAVTLKGILREYPTTSIRNHTAKLGYNIWKDLLLWVNGSQFSLDDIEHKILRKMGEPRIHFAIVCASKGCPQLWNRAYTAEGLDGQLSANARRFFAQSRHFQADAGSRTVYVSQLLKWYGSDFAADPVAQVRMLRPYFPEPDKLAWIASGPVSVRHLDYDWGLNDQAPVSR